MIGSIIDFLFNRYKEEHCMKCGTALTNSEIHYYGYTCEKCETKQYKKAQRKDRKICSK